MDPYELLCGALEASSWHSPGRLSDTAVSMLTVVNPTAGQVQEKPNKRKKVTKKRV